MNNEMGSGGEVGVDILASLLTASGSDKTKWEISLAALDSPKITDEMLQRARSKME